MKKGKLGFTLIEVAIFLAVTGALFVSVAVGVRQSIYQQRQNDAVQGFVEFLRGAYAGVTNVQSTSTGMSKKAIYGKLITFGESTNLNGDNTDGNEIFMYTVVGDIQKNDGSNEGALSLLAGGNDGLLNKLKLNVFQEITSSNGSKGWGYAGITESYTPKWSAEIQPPCGDDVSLSRCGAESNEPIKASILIVRHPVTGTIYTLYAKSTIEVNAMMKQLRENPSGNSNPFDFRMGANEYSYLDGGNNRMDDGRAFKTSQQIDFCINTTGEINVTNRPDVRIERDARNSSAINVFAADTEGYQCGK